MSDRYQDTMDKALQCIHLARAINDRYDDPSKMPAAEVGQRKSLLAEAMRLQEIADTERSQAKLESWAAAPDADQPAVAAMASKAVTDAKLSGGSKDSEGKTVPRSLRHFPVHDAAHVRNALARAPQSPFGDQAMPKILAAARKLGVKVSESASLSFAQFTDLAVKAAVSLHELFTTYLDDAAGPADEPDPTAAAAAPAGTAETKDAAAYAASFLSPPGPRDGAPEGEPPGALAYPQQLLESLKDEAAFDALEASINQALGRAAQ